MTQPLNRQKYIGAVEILEEEMDLTILKRKPIGWNYQNAINPPKQVNGECALPSKSTSFLPYRSSTDDVEVLEVREVTPIVHQRPLFPSSSTKKEIKSILRNVTQSSIHSFCSVVSSPGKDGQSKLAFSTSRKSQLALHKPPKKVQEAEVTHAELNGLHLEDVKKRVKEKEKEEEEEEVNPPRETNESSESSQTDLVEVTSEYSQFTLQKFIDRWKCLQPFSKDEEKIRDKIWKNYYASHTSYIHSRRFINDLQKATENLMKTENIYVYISKLISCLKRYKDTPYLEKKKRLQEGEEERNEEGAEILTEEVKKRRKMARVEHEMMKLSKKIKKLEEAEVDLDDEVNSSYLILERLKSTFVKLDEYYCKLANCSTSTGRPVEKKFKYEGSRYPEINKRITAWVNKNRCFPEYVDILDLVKNISKRNNLPLRPETVRVQAQEIFRDVGKILKERRERDDLFSIYAYAFCDDATLSLDPANDNPDLCQKLRDNEKTAREMLDKVFQYYVDKEAEAKGKKEKGCVVGETSRGKETATKRNVDEGEAEGRESEKGSGLEDAERKDLVEEVVDSSLDENDDNNDDDDDEDEDDSSLPDLIAEETEKEGQGRGERGSLGLKASETESPANSNDANGLDESDDDIQEILTAPAEGEEEDEEEEEEEEEIKEECYLTEEDVEVAVSPTISLVNDLGIDVEEDDPNDRSSPLSEVTYFKRKSEGGDHAVPFKRTRCLRDALPEVVEID